MGEDSTAAPASPGGAPAASVAPLGPRMIGFALVATAGMAALSWELLWQIRASLSIGVSALGTAIVLAATMGGMSAGAVVGGRLLRRRQAINPLLVYGGIELTIGACGLLFQPAFVVVERIDSAIYLGAPALAPLVHLFGIIVILGVPTFAMGATVPLFGLMARRLGTRIGILYGLNTAGASLGTLAMAFWIVPTLGLGTSAQVIASLNLIVGIAAISLRGATASPGTPEVATPEVAAPETAAPTVSPGPACPIPFGAALAVAAVTGFATFALEVAWFRALKAAFQSSAETFAIILAAVLIPLGAAAPLASWLRRRGASIGPVLLAAGVAILVTTPIVERIDLLAVEISASAQSYGGHLIRRLVASLVLLGGPVLLLGVSLPWLLEHQDDPVRWGRLYGANTAAAIAGSLAAGWLLLPIIGFAQTAWVVGAVVAGAGVLVASGRVRIVGVVLAVAALGVAVGFETGIGRLRVQGRFVSTSRRQTLVDFEHGPDATVAVVELDVGVQPRPRALIIDGFQATDERGQANYMEWMGRLPMLAHDDPRRALVICFGTGQTAHAVRDERPSALDVVDLSPAVLRMGHHFATNYGVLDDERVRAISMDGRAWLRRTDERYSIVTLEPMPPDWAGSNALYSREFYELIDARLEPGGIVAQWLPLHLLAPFWSASVVATFQSVFEDTVLWGDPMTTTVIVLGRKADPDDDAADPWSFPGIARPPEVGRGMPDERIAGQVVLRGAGVGIYAATGEVITDDNQLLSFGDSRRERLLLGGEVDKINQRIIREAAAAARSGS